MLLLFDIGNTHTHVGLADNRRVLRQINVPTREWFGGKPPRSSENSQARKKLTARSCAASFRAPRRSSANLRALWNAGCMLELTPKTVCGMGIDYPKPGSIGPDRLANAVAARQRFGAPVVVVDFGTAVTFDVVNRAGNYAGGIIAPGLAAMTDYLHEKTALLPRIEIPEVKTIIGKSTEAGDAHRRGAWLSRSGARTDCGIEARTAREKTAGRRDGRFAKLIAAKLPEISAVAPDLTLEGLRLVWQKQAGWLSPNKTGCKN